MNNAHTNYKENESIFYSFLLSSCIKRMIVQFSLNKPQITRVMSTLLKRCIFTHKKMQQRKTKWKLRHFTLEKERQSLDFQLSKSYLKKCTRNCIPTKNVCYFYEFFHFVSQFIRFVTHNVP